MHRATRRISILLIAMFAFSGLALAGTAGASTAAKPATSCAAQVKKFATINGLSSKDAQDPANLGKIAGKVANVYKSMAKSAPPKVKASLNRLAKAYNGLKGIKLTDASSVKKFTAFGKTMSKDIATVSGYFASNCSG